MLQRAKGCVEGGGKGSHEKWTTPGGRSATLKAAVKDQAPGTGELTIDWHISGTVGNTAAKARAARSQVDELTRSAVRELRQSGFSLRDTGELTGISFQRAQQIEKELLEADAQ